GDSFTALALVVIDDISHQPHQVGNPSALDRHVGNGRVFHQLTDGRVLGFEQRSGRGNLYGFRDRAEFETDVERMRATGFENNGGTHELLEARHLAGNLIWARLQERENVKPSRLGGVGLDDSSGSVLRGDRGTGNHG